MIARFAVDFDGTLVEDDKYPLIGEWLPGATEFLQALERIGRVVIYTCRTAPAHHLTEEPRRQEDVDDEIARIRDVLREQDFGHLEIWTKPYKPPAAAYIDNKAVLADRDFGAMLERVLDLLAPISVRDGDKTYRYESEIEVDDDYDDITAFIQDMGTCEDCPYPEGCDLHEGCEKEQGCDVAPIDWSIVRHPSSQRFHEILRELGELHDQKSIGYGTATDPLANVRASTDWGIPAWQGAMLRLGDKLKRLQAYAQKGSLPFEPAEDAFRDAAVYAVIGLVLFEQEAART